MKCSQKPIHNALVLRLERSNFTVSLLISITSRMTRKVHNEEIEKICL